MSSNIPPGNNNRLVQVSEQVFDPIRVPVTIGNEVYVVSQQDIRNITETRVITWEKVQGNICGDSPVEGGALNNILNLGQSLQLNPNSGQPFQAPNIFNPPGPNITGNCPRNQFVAPIQTQLDWEMRSVEHEPPNQFCYSKATSTSDLKRVNFCIPKEPEFLPCPKFISRGVNITEDDFREECSTKLSAYEQLKQKKMSKYL